LKKSKRNENGRSRRTKLETTSEYNNPTGRGQMYRAVARREKTNVKRRRKQKKNYKTQEERLWAPPGIRWSESSKQEALQGGT